VQEVPGSILREIYDSLIYLSIYFKSNLTFVSKIACLFGEVQNSQMHVFPFDDIILTICWELFDKKMQIKSHCQYHEIPNEAKLSGNANIKT